ncbi:phage tail family protein [Lacticaseibacillus rhamnosus]|uniref:distal tail protein Dit n=1 Tax=Lacticaseibacillus rhamnosus TaxID=47715 RepID=UPI001013D162|nr:distal tail protein Dit [Lacticaseibacillus rhamnosus]RXS51988.1 phage tail family protein [Lacticaseibacillus rhamnosus]
MANLIFGGHKIGSSSLQFSAARGVFSEVENTTQPVGAGDGEMLIRSRLKSRIIPVTYDFVALSRREFERQLAPLLYSTGVQKLIIDDRPDEFWYAKVDGKIDMDRAYFLGTGTINFLVPDGIAHSVATKTADNMPYKDVPMNMLTDSGFESGKTPSGIVWGTSSDDDRTAEVNPAMPSYPTPFGTYMLRIENQSSDSSIDPDQYIVFPLPTPVTIKAGETWTYSYKYAAAGSATGQASDYLTTNGLSPIRGLSMGHGNRDTDGGQDTWHQFSATMTADSDITVTNYRFGFVKTYAGGGWICIDNIKLEKNDTASPWSPNPADPEYYSDTITVHNGGTYPVEPVITATMHADNGVVAFVNDQGSVLQFGSPSEIDGVVRQKSERVYHFDFENEPKGIVMNAGALTYPNYRDNPSTPNKQKGIFSYGRPDGYDNAIAYPNTERNPSNYWSGPSMSGKLAANSNGEQNGNFEWRNLIRFATMTNWAGRVEFNLTYEGKIVASLALYDQSTTDDQVMFEGKIHDGNEALMLFHEALPRDLYSRANSFAVISKMGDQLTFRIDRVGGGNVIKPFTIDGFASQSIDGWTAWFSAFSDVLEANMGWQDSYFDWVNVDYWTDVPNRFKDGDVVKVDVANRVIYLNGAEDPTLQTVGNNWEGFQLLPGKNTIQVLQSDWAEPYTCQVEWQEAWL